MKPSQLKLPGPFASILLASVEVVRTDDLSLDTEAGIEACVRRMLDVPLEKSVLLDFLVGYKRGDGHATEEHAELHRLQLMLNSRFRGRRFDWLGPGLAPRLARGGIVRIPQILADIMARREEADRAKKT